jgi:hypothetical protein
MKVMLPSLRRLVPAALLLTASGALADSPLPATQLPAKEIVTHAPAGAQTQDEQLRALNRTVESIEAEVQQLRAKDAERAVREAELSGQNDHPLWP